MTDNAERKSGRLMSILGSASLASDSTTAVDMSRHDEPMSNDNDTPQSSPPLGAFKRQTESLLHHALDSATDLAKATMYGGKESYKKSKSWLFTNENKHALQVALSVLVAAMFVVDDSLAHVFDNGFWIGVTVVTVLDNSLGSLLRLGFQRMAGTALGGILSLCTSVLTWLIYTHCQNIAGDAVLLTLMSFQIIYFTKLRNNPAWSYAGSIGNVTTVIILLTGYKPMHSSNVNLVLRNGGWRMLDVVLGVIISTIISLLIFPIKSHGILRQNMSNYMCEAADVFEQCSKICFGIEIPGDREPERQTTRMTRAGSLIASAPKSITDHLKIQKPLPNSSPTSPGDVEEGIFKPLKFDERVEIEDMSSKCLNLLVSLEKELARVENAKNEYFIQIPFDFCFRRKHYQLGLRRAKRYSQAIKDMRSMVWPLSTFNLLLPLLWRTKEKEEEEDLGKHWSLEEHRLKPTSATCNSIWKGCLLMRKLANMLGDKDLNLSRYKEWARLASEIRSIEEATQCELEALVTRMRNRQALTPVGNEGASEYFRVGNESDVGELIWYYGFLSRCQILYKSLAHLILVLGNLQLEDGSHQ
ncbi:hypothetical protein BZG36_01024 [Bifiguratus adelaidae]|uniref:Uncharacterized protein n=1 Tax=Bifiguratus adelaidae TaxID=1938954 RepID=A0A261Y6G9_9FUNG|nr:hypothetical protein BZG36_01024 [Bifiguratus adelaidae]